MVCRDVKGKSNAVQYIQLEQGTGEVSIKENWKTVKQEVECYTLQDLVCNGIFSMRKLQSVILMK